MHYSDYTIIAALLQRHITGTLTAVEQAQLDQWVKLSPENEQLFHQMDDPATLQSWMQENETSRTRMLQQLTAAIPGLLETQPSVIAKPTHRIHFLKTAWFRYAAAVLIAISIGVYLWNNFKTPETIVHTQSVPAKNDVLPGSDKAILTLSSGQQVELSKTTAETIQDGSLSIQNNNGQLVYTPQNGSSGLQRSNNGKGISYNTMTTPRGGQYQLTLADGTRVWLNAESSITFPTAFAGPNREVKITGEAYFEVMPNKEKPFIVTTAQESVTVLGTSFNVNHYQDEPAMKISLVEGSVKVDQRLLKPGEAWVNGKIMKTDITQDLAWKNGIFNFHEMDIDAALRQLARWYDIQIHYEGTMPVGKLGGRMGRNLKLSQVLNVLDGVVARLQLQGKVLHVTPL